MTLGMKEIMSADQVILMAVARNKAQLVAEILGDKEGRSPAAHVLLHHPRVKLFLDAKAASALPQFASSCPRELKGFNIINDAEIYSEIGRAHV